jgi:RHS repeat-associated protein
MAWATPADGGLLRSPDDRVLLAIPAGAVSERTRFTYAPLADLAGLPPNTRLAFTLEASPANSPFAPPAVLKLFYGDGLVPDGFDESTVRLLRLDPIARLAEPVDATLDPDRRVLTAPLDRPGLYALAADAEQPAFFHPRLEAGQVALFTGDAAFSYELDTPAGAGGLRLPLTLRYSGALPNAMTSETNYDGGWVGAGWTLDLGQIQAPKDRPAAITLDGLSGEMVDHTQLAYAAGTVTEPDLDADPFPTERCDQFFGGYDAGDSNGWYTRRWRPRDERFALIQSRLFAGWVKRQDLCPVDGVENLGQWDIWSKEGLHYVFGSQPFDPVGEPPCTAATTATGSRAFIRLRGEGDGVDLRRYTVYKLDTVSDPHGNTLQVDYGVYGGQNGPYCDLLSKEAYPTLIRYTTNPAAGDTLAEYEVEFQVSPKAHDYEAAARLAETGYLLDSVTVWFRPAAGAPRERIRRYQLAYDHPTTGSPSGLYVLREIRQYGRSDADLLPATTFTYLLDDDHRVGWKSSPAGWTYYRARPFLSAIANGYGAVAAFHYAPLCIPADNPGCLTGDVGTGLQQKVAARTLDPGYGAAQRSDYTYADPSYQPPEFPEDQVKLKAFIGFARVVEALSDGAGQPLRRSDSAFVNARTGAVPGDPYQGDGHHPLRGKRTANTTGSWTGAAWAEHSRTAITYTDFDAAAAAAAGIQGWPPSVHFVYPNSVVESDCRDAACLEKTTTYAYDLYWQDRCGAPGATPGYSGAGGGQFGNLTRITELDGNVPLRTTLRAFCPNAQPNLDPAAAVWNLARPAFGQVYEGAVADPPQEPDETAAAAATWFIYADDQASPFPSWQQPIGARGELRGERRLAQTGSAGELMFSDTRFRHDAAGNVIERTIFTGFGSPTAWAASGPATTATTYDPLHRTFVTAGTTPQNAQGQALTTSYAYYGVNAEATGSGLPGQLQQVSDPNQAVTRYAYDGLGRLTAEARPGDSLALPTTSYVYTDTLLPPVAARYDRERSGCASCVRPTLTFFDGLGRAIQTKTESQDFVEMVVADTRYSPLGPVHEQYVPTFDADPARFAAFVPLDTARPKIATAYDALARPTAVTQPDGTADRTYYRPRQVARIDAGDRLTIRASDALGRLAQADRLCGSYPGEPGWSDTPCASSSYTYDPAGRLLAVTGPDQAVTTLSYDYAGHKTQLADPDMGSWRYRYDGVGLLIKQLDPRGSLVCHQYDALGRLTSKSYHPGVADPADINCSQQTPAVAYTYDQGPFGLGRRTAMTDPSGAAAWEYDPRGNLVEETKTIAGHGSFLTRWAYDAAGRQTFIQLPGGNAGQPGEQISTAYTPGWLPYAVTGDRTYVAAAAYDPAGRLTERRLGANAVLERYAYPQTTNYRLATASATTAGSGTPLQALSYAYDAVGNLLSSTDAAAFGGSQTQAFTYDPLHRLATAQATGGGPAYGEYPQQSYAYGPAGNLDSFAGAQLAYLDPAHPHAVTHVAGTQLYWYDAAGNVTHRTYDAEDVTVTYDAENHLTAMAGTVTASHVYDGDGKRVVETVDGVTRIFVNDAYEVDNGVPRSYVSHAGARIAVVTGGTLHFLLRDHLGSTTITLDENGNRVQLNPAGADPNTELRYTPFGAARYNTGGQPTTFRFTAQRWDPATATYFLGTRWYDPLVGRFLQPDSIVPQPGDPQGLNRYTYANNNPTRYVDPTGHWVETAWDVLNIGWDIYQVKRDPSLLNIGALAVDVGAAALPFVPAGAGLVARGGRASKAAIEVASHAEDVIGAARQAERTVSGADHLADVARTLAMVGSQSGDASALVREVAEASTRNGRVQGGITMLGSYDEYINMARLEGVTYFDMPKEAYDALTKASGDLVWEVNRQFLDDSIAAGHGFVITVGEGKEIGRYLQREIEYLTQHGYTLVDGVFVRD